MSKHRFNLEAMKNQKAHILFPEVRSIPPTPIKLQDVKQ